MTRTRIYRNPGPHSTAPCTKVVLTETYNHSAHWWLRAYPKGYGAEPAPLVFARDITGEPGEWEIKVEEGYGIFRIEIADAFARALTGAEDYTDE